MSPFQRAAKVIVSVDYGFTRTKRAFAVVYRGQPDSSIEWEDVEDVVPGVSPYSTFQTPMNIGHVPSASFYRPNQAPRFGWQALSDIRNNTQQSYYNSRTYYVAGVKPKTSFPESAWSKDDLPDPAPTSRTTSIPAPEQQSPTTWTGEQATLLRRLKDECHITHEEDVIIQYLTWTFNEIEACTYGPWRQGFVDETTQIVFAVTCPVAWNRPTRAQYKRLVEVAAANARLGRHETAHRGWFHCLPDDEMVAYQHLLHVHLYTEPEAAARWMLARMPQDDLAQLCRTVVLVYDIGGGTADLVPYYVETGNEFHRVSAPLGDECGSDMLNNRLEKRVLSRLEDQRDMLEKLHAKKLEDIISMAMDDFENYRKPTLNTRELLAPGVHDHLEITILGYIPSCVQGTLDIRNKVIISRDELSVHVFQPWLKRNARLLRAGLRSILSMQPRGVAIFLIGGGADQPMLRPYLQKHVVGPLHNSSGAEVRFAESPFGRQSGTFVARGAVLAAGSAATITGWKAHVNIGMLRQICYQDLDGDTALALKDIPRELDPDSQDGTELIRNVPTWIIRQDREYSSTERFPDIDSIHIWYEDEAKWALDETFVALVGVASDHLPITDKKNNGHRIVHAINGEDVDVKSIMKDANIRGIPWHRPATKRRRGISGTRRAGVTTQYIAETKVRCYMQGTDLVVASEWRSPDGTWWNLAQRTLNVAESFSIDRIATYERRNLS